ncbi:MAG: hypothetical protein ACYCPR_10640 [Thermoplasmataceae archaeon]
MIKTVVGKKGVFIPFRSEGMDQALESPDLFIASESPLYLGLILKPSKGLWEYMKNSSEIVLCHGDRENCAEMSIPYKIEVGENTIFFLKPDSAETLRRIGI